MGYQPTPSPQSRPQFIGYSGTFEGINGYSGCSGAVGLSGYSGFAGFTGLQGYSGAWNHFDETFKDFDETFDKPTNDSGWIITPTIKSTYKTQHKFKMPKIPKKVWLFLIPISSGIVTIILLKVLEKIAIK